MKPDLIIVTDTPELHRTHLNLLVRDLELCGIHIVFASAPVPDVAQLDMTALEPQKVQYPIEQLIRHYAPASTHEIEPPPAPVPAEQRMPWLGQHRRRKW